MADKEVAALTSATDLDGTELVHVVQGGNSRKATTASFARRTVKTLTAPFSSSSATLAQVTDGTTAWALSLTSGRTYRIQVIGTYQTAATATGAGIGFVNASGATGTVNGSARGAVTTAVASSELAKPIISLSSSMFTTQVSNINQPHHMSMDVVVVCTGTGTVDIGFATEVGGSAAQLNTGSTLIVEDIT